MKKLNKIIGPSLILIGILIPLSTFSISKIKEEQEEKVLVQKIDSKNYFAIIEIPKISLKKEIYDINDELNNVNKNILVHKSSIFPQKIILASHSGTGTHAYFKNLYKLQINDNIKIYYQNKIYEYIIYEIEQQNKIGKLYIKEDNYEKLILITCSKNNNKAQNIYYSYLKSITDV